MFVFDVVTRRLCAEFFSGTRDKVTVGELESADHRTRIAQTCATIGWTFATHRTDRPPETALLALHTAIAGGGFYAPGGRDARLSKGG